VHDIQNKVVIYDIKKINKINNIFDVIQNYNKIFKMKCKL